MEAAAIAWVTEQTKTPLIGIKVVTDIADGGELVQEEFLQNLESAAISLQNTLGKII